MRVNDRGEFYLVAGYNLEVRPKDVCVQFSLTDVCA